MSGCSGRAEKLMLQIQMLHSSALQISIGRGPPRPRTLNRPRTPISAPTSTAQNRRNSPKNFSELTPQQQGHSHPRP
jgi:hypothetical protein